MTPPPRQASSRMTHHPRRCIRPSPSSQQSRTMSQPRIRRSFAPPSPMAASPTAAPSMQGLRVSMSKLLRPLLLLCTNTTLFLLLLLPSHTFAMGGYDGQTPTLPLLTILPFTDRNKPNIQHSIQLPFTHMASTLLAIKHFNERDGSVVRELSLPEFALPSNDEKNGSDDGYRGGCDVQIPTRKLWTIKDGGNFMTTAVRALLQAKEAHNDIGAVIGPYSNKPALGVGIVSAAMEAPLLSYGQADTAKFGRNNIYPLTAKITGDEYAKAEMLMDYIKNYRGRDYVVLIHTTDIADGPPKVLDHAAKKFNVNFITEPITPPFVDGVFSIPSVLQRIVDSGYRTIIYAVSKVNQWNILYPHAEQMGMVGPDANYVWFAYDTVDMEALTQRTDNVAKMKLLNGAGAMRIMDKFAYREDLDHENDDFLDSWKSQGSEFVNHVNSMNPVQLTEKYNETNSLPPPGFYHAEDDYFQTHDPKLYSGFIYDSVIALGMAACRLRSKVLLNNQTKEGSTRGRKERRNLLRKRRDLKWWPNTGVDNDFYNELVEVNFTGASGDVVLHDFSLYNRNPKTIAWGMYNIRLENNDNEKTDSVVSQRTGDASDNTTESAQVVERGFDVVLTAIRRIDSEVWTIAKEGEDFIYADGTTNEPMPLKTIIPQNEDESSDSFPIWIVVVIMVSILLLTGVVVYLYVSHKRKQADSVWNVKTSELIFDDPPEVIGRGTFGLVLLAEYRGTQVAVKRVIPPRLKKHGGGKEQQGKSSTLSTESKHSKASSTLSVGDEVLPLEESSPPVEQKEKEGAVQSDAAGDEQEGSISGVDVEMDTWKAAAQGRSSSADENENDDDAPALGIKSGTYNNNGTMGSMGLGTSYDKMGTLSKRLKGIMTGGTDAEYRRLKKEFISEMRQLSKLRHPCITTVMGAVISKFEEPMLVMEFMDHGSLYDLLHNETLILEGDLLLPILQDIAQGVRFLHAATPKQIIHSDLKSANVLVDSKFRAKVADFGLSQKKRVGAMGTPYWMAPELLRRECDNNAMTDVYSFGIILYEVYSRKDPYEGEKYRDVIQQIADPNINKRPPIPEACPPSVQTLMTDCLTAKPDDRPTFEELDTRLKRLTVETVEPGDMPLSMQNRKRDQNHIQRTDKLLFEVFPQPIAEALRDGRKVEPEYRDIVTIFFSDIVGFTNISSTLSPIKISDMLDRLYNRFDELSRYHDVFKVETIGDAYMAVTNLVKDQPNDHTKRIANFAIDALRAANETMIDMDDTTKGYVNIRVGFHSGPVVANVVGSRNPRYCLFGDTVNTASRMESNSQKNRIHCSDRAAKLLWDQCPEMKTRSRGNITVKGKGEMRTFWVNEEPRQNRRGSASSVGSIDSFVARTMAEHRKAERRNSAGARPPVVVSTTDTNTALHENGTRKSLPNGISIRDPFKRRDSMKWTRTKQQQQQVDKN